MTIYGNLASYSSPHGHQNFFTKALKRIADIVFSALLLVISSPLFIILAILIKRDSPGAVFFRQERVGKNGRLFSMFKFRTMYAEANKYDYHPRGRDDARITKIGRMLRKTSLDELPQLMNVITGEMSLVGPRPEMPFIVKEYSQIQKQRLTVKPGLTGLWQISADRSKPIHENMEYDLYYVNNHSPLLDLAIILRTVISVIRGIGAH
ncbi:MAG: sugar transferase [Candidatus Omnitrophica bacterium]|nr:sugar transferase [Candidatus Omnitrophota bacterium]